MKIYIDAFGDFSILLIQQMMQHLRVPTNNVFVRTYPGLNNSELINFLNISNIKFSLASYDDKSLFESIGFHPDVVMSFFGRDLIPASIYQNASKTINIHPSLLPKYAGCFSVPWAIIQGDDLTGVTFHELTSQFDTGKIIAQFTVPIDPVDTSFSLYAKIKNTILSNFIDVLNSYLLGDLKPIMQTTIGASYFKRELPYNGKINPNWDIHRIDKFIRAMIYPPFQLAVLETKFGDLNISSIQQYLLERSKI